MDVQTKLCPKGPQTSVSAVTPSKACAVSHIRDVRSKYACTCSLQIIVKHCVQICGSPRSSGRLNTCAAHKHNGQLEYDARLAAFQAGSAVQ